MEHEAAFSFLAFVYAFLTTFGIFFGTVLMIDNVIDPWIKQIVQEDHEAVLMPAAHENWNQRERVAASAAADAVCTKHTIEGRSLRMEGVSRADVNDMSRRYADELHHLDALENRLDLAMYPAAKFRRSATDETAAEGTATAEETAAEETATEGTAADDDVSGEEVVKVDEVTEESSGLWSILRWR